MRYSRDQTTVPIRCLVRSDTLLMYQQDQATGMRLIGRQYWSRRVANKSRLRARSLTKETPIEVK